MSIKIGLTGSSGIIGSKFLEKFETKYFFQKFVGNMTNLDHVNQFMKKDFDILIHLASIIPQYEKNGLPTKQSFSENVIGTENICKMASKCDKKVIFLSTQRVYKTKNNVRINEMTQLEPDTDYGKSKLESEKIIQQYFPSENYAILRISNICGTYPKRPSIIDSIAESMLRNKPLKIGLHPETLRDYIYIDDVIIALEKSLNQNGIFNICSGNSYNTKEIINIFKKIYGTLPDITFGKYKPKNILLDNNKAIRDLNFKPKTVDEGILLTVKLIKNFLEANYII